MGRRPLLLLPLLLAACSKSTDARARSEVEAFLHGLVRSVTSQDLDAFAAHFRPEAPVVIHFQKKTKRTTLELYREHLEESRDLIEKNEVKLLTIAVEERGPDRYLARTTARETSVVSGRTLEGDSTSTYEIERTPGGLRVVSYETWIFLTRVRDPQAGEFDPRLYPGRVSWDDPLAR